MVGLLVTRGVTVVFFEAYNFETQAWEVTDPVLKDPEQIYASDEDAPSVENIS